MSATSTLRRRSKRHKKLIKVERTVTTARQSEKTYWNGEPAQCRRVLVKVGTVERPTWWCAGLEGTERKAVEVNYGGQRFCLDNENGSAWLKVTLGGGGPEWGHSSLPDDSTVIRELESD
jgi:hypothetical protein